MANQPTMAEMERQIAELREQLAALSGRTVRHDPTVQADYVARGSDEHAAMLGLRKATEIDGEFVIEGWALDDITNFPPTATPEWLKRTLQQKVNELISPVPVMQSSDPRKPGYAPTMWDPGTGRPFRQMTED